MRPSGPAVVRNRREGTAPGQARLAVVVEDGDLAAVGVVVVGEGAVGAPLEAVRDRHAARPRPRSRRPGRAGRSTPRPASCRRPSCRSRSGRRDRSRLRSSGSRRRPELLERLEAAVGVLEGEAALDPDHRAAAAPAAAVPPRRRRRGGARPRRRRRARGRRRRACRPSAARPSAPTRPAPRRGRRPSR